MQQLKVFIIPLFKAEYGGSKPNLCRPYSTRGPQFGDLAYILLMTQWPHHDLKSGIKLIFSYCVSSQITFRFFIYKKKSYLKINYVIFKGICNLVFDYLKNFCPRFSKTVLRNLFAPTAHFRTVRNFTAH